MVTPTNETSFRFIQNNSTSESLINRLLSYIGLRTIQSGNMTAKSLIGRYVVRSSPTYFGNDRFMRNPIQILGVSSSGIDYRKIECSPKSHTPLTYELDSDWLDDKWTEAQPQIHGFAFLHNKCRDITGDDSEKCTDLTDAYASAVTGDMRGSGVDAGAKTYIDRNDVSGTLLNRCSIDNAVYNRNCEDAAKELFKLYQKHRLVESIS